MKNQIELPYDFIPRDYQMPLWKYLESGGRKACVVWHRRAGKDLFAINRIACASQERVGTYWHVLPTYNQGRKIVWDGSTKDGRKFLDHFPKDLIASKNNTDMRITFKNGSVYQVVGADDPDRLVGANPVGVVFSEYSLMDPKVYTLIQPILSENEGWCLFIFTPRGKNHGWKLMEVAKESPVWYGEVLGVDTTGAVPLERIDEDREAGMPEEMVKQEYYCSFEAPIVGAYYANQMMYIQEKGQITNVPWEPTLDVHTAWDLGVSDSTCIWFYQQVNKEIRIIDYYEASGEGLSHYIKMLGGKPYSYGDHFAPHDIAVRELGSGKSRLETARSLGIRFRVVQRHEVMDGIESVRNILPKCWFDKEATDRGLQCLRSYRKEWDEKNQTYAERPKHDWASHGADAFRYLAWGFRGAKKKRSDFQEKALDDYNIFA